MLKTPTTPWINAEHLDETKHIGIVYRIDRVLVVDGLPTDIVLRSYVGKKLILTQKKVKLTIKELAELPKKPGKKPTHKRVVKHTDWQKYWSSSKTLQADLKELGESHFRRTILLLCPSKKTMAYGESQLLFALRVLESDVWYNDNIGGTFYHRDTIGIDLIPTGG